MTSKSLFGGECHTLYNTVSPRHIQSIQSDLTNPCCARHINMGYDLFQVRHLCDEEQSATERSILPRVQDPPRQTGEGFVGAEATHVGGRHKQGWRGYPPSFIQSVLVNASLFYQ